MRGVGIATARRLDTDGWNATTLSLYSHSGTHMDAPRHFLPDGRTLDGQDLAVCVGPARVIDVTPTEPKQLLTVEHLGVHAEQIEQGDRLLFRTDWHLRHGTPAYRDELPRISLDLARWLVERRVALIGVEPPSVADVNNMAELTEVHQTLFRGDVLIVEGLAYLDRLTSPMVEFVALPLKIVGGDGSPVRAIAIER
ncbi:MAG: cyclase family protein [Planctomycetota bacterium]